MCKRVLIIGANSYIAKALLSHNDDGIVYDKVSASNGEWEHQSFIGYDAVIMLAAIVHKKEDETKKQLYHEVNYELPVKVAKKAKQSGVRYYIFVSTAAIYGSSVTRVNKNTTPNPDTLYGKSKLEAEIELVKLQEGNQFKVGIIRPPMVYGEGCKGNYPRLERLAKYTPLFPAIHNKRSMIHIDTLCKYIRNMVIEETTNIVLPQDDFYTDTSLLVKQIRKNMGKRTILVPGTAWLIRLLMKRSRALSKMFGDWWYEREG